MNNPPVDPLDVAIHALDADIRAALLVKMLDFADRRGFRLHLHVIPDASCAIPKHLLDNPQGRLVSGHPLVILSFSAEAVTNRLVDTEHRFITARARFNGQPHDVFVSFHRIHAIAILSNTDMVYTHQLGAYDLIKPEPPAQEAAPAPEAPAVEKTPPKRGHLTRIK